MQPGDRLTKHREKLTSIRLSLTKMALFNHTSLEMARRLEQNDLLKMSPTLNGPQSGEFTL
jgi:hypothetical protein